MPDKPTIPNYPPQGIQAQLDLLYLYNPDAANQLVEQLEAGLSKLEDFQAQIEKALNDLQGVMRYKGSVATEADLPTEGNINGDVWNIQDTDENVAWDGEKLDKFGSAIDASKFITTEGGQIDGVLSIGKGGELRFPNSASGSAGGIIKYATNQGFDFGIWNRTTPAFTSLASLQRHGLNPAVAKNGQLTLGDEGQAWKEIHGGKIVTQIISNGADINIPNKAGTLALLEDIPEEHAMVTDQSLSGSGTTESPLGLSQIIHNEIDSLAASVAELGADKIDTWESTKFVSPAFTFDATGMASTSINLGELEDGTYEFVVNCRLGVRTGYGAYRVHIVIENGELKQNQDNTLSFICPFMDGQDGAGRLLGIYHNHSAPKAAYLDKEGNAFVLKVTQAFMYTNLFLSHFFFGENQTVAGLTRVSYIKNMETEAFTAPSAITVSSTVEPKTEGTFIAFQSPMEMSVPTTVHRDVFGSVTANALLVNNTKGLMYQTLNVRLYDTENPKTQHFYADVTVYDTGNATVTSWDAAGKFAGAQLAYDAEGNIFIRKANGTPILDGTLNVVSQMSWYHLDDTDVDLQYFLSSLTSTEGTAIPLATRMPALPTDTGTYALKCINGFPQWEYEGGAE